MKTLLEEAPLALFESPTVALRKDYSEWAVQFDSASLAVKTWGNSTHPTAVLVHGYPDNSEVRHEMASLLVRDCHAVVYDVRDTGRSSSSSGMRNYIFARLADDFIAVINALDPGKSAYLIMYDWGSIQSWKLVVEERPRGHIASYTSYSGPCLDHVGHQMRAWLLRPAPSSLSKMLGQFVRS